MESSFFTSDGMTTSLIDATQFTLATMAGVEVEPEQTFSREEWKSWGEYTAIYDLSTKGCDVVFMLSFDQTSAATMVEGVFGNATQFVETDAIDLTSEFINTIVGAMKSVLVDEGIELPMSQPTAVIGQNKVVSQLVASERTAILFRCGDGAFVVEGFCRKHS